MGSLAVLLVPRRARGHWDEEAFVRLRRRTTWLAIPPAMLAGLLSVILLAVVEFSGDVLSAVIWVAVTVFVFYFLRRIIHRAATRALRTTVHLHPPEPEAGSDPPDADPPVADPDKPPPVA